MNDIDPEAIQQIAPRWANEVATPLDRAIVEVAKTELVHASGFTVVAPAMASVHVVAENYFQRNLEAQIKNAEEFQARLNAAAAAWIAAEEQNTTNNESGG